MIENEVRKIPLYELIDLLIKVTSEYMDMSHKESQEIVEDKKKELELLQQIIDTKMAEDRPR